MDKSKILKELLKATHLKEDDYYNSNVFYYLAGRFPELTIAECADIVTDARQELRNAC